MTPESERPWLIRILADHPALVFSGLYAFASVIGLIYSWLYLRPFGINVLEYSEISDFLLASLKEPLTWLLTLFAFLLVQIDNLMSRRVEARGGNRWTRWYGTERYRQINNPVAMIMIVIFLWVLADSKHETVRDGGGDRFRVTLADGSPPVERVLLGTTVKFVFLYDRDSERVFIHPNENVLTLSRRPPDLAAATDEADAQPDAKPGGGPADSAEPEESVPDAEPADVSG